jgi:hypothetical protein
VVLRVGGEDLPVPKKDAVLVAVRKGCRRHRRNVGCHDVDSSLARGASHRLDPPRLFFGPHERRRLRPHREHRAFLRGVSSACDERLIPCVRTVFAVGATLAGLTTESQTRGCSMMQTPGDRPTCAAKGDRRRRPSPREPGGPRRRRPRHRSRSKRPPRMRRVSP